jgi:hypothetical protein
MGKLHFNIPYNVNTDLIISPSEVIEKYLFGIPICDSKGKQLSQNIISDRIIDAQELIESLLYIKFKEQIIRETSNFMFQEWNSWSFVKTSYNVKKALQLEGYYNQVKQIGYPSNWLNVRYESSSQTVDNDVIFRQIHVIPSGSTGNPSSQGVTFNGVVPFANMLGLKYIPNYWVSTYITGFSVVPKQLVSTVGKLVAIQLLAMLGDTYNNVGMSSYSISLDGLSQNTSLLKSTESGIYGSRIKQYMTDLFGDGKTFAGSIDGLKAKYRGMIMDCM